MPGEMINSFTFTHENRKFLARVYADHDMGRPWEEHDGHGDIREGYTGFTGYAEKRGGEVVIGEVAFSHRKARVWLYDVAATIKRARKEGWGISEQQTEALGVRLYAQSKTPKPRLTKREIVAEAVRLDMERMSAWLNDRWTWCGVSVVEMPDFSKAIEALESYDGGDVTDGNDWQTEAIEALRELESREPREDYANALWGIESDAGEEYFLEVAKELADQI